MKADRKKVGLLSGIVVLAIAALLIVYAVFGPKAVEGKKTIVFEVITENTDAEEFTLHTDAKYLGEVLLEEGLIVGEAGDYGLFVTEVNGIAANVDHQEWWCFTKAGENVNTGVDQTPIMDGDHFEATLMIGY